MKISFLSVIQLVNVKSPLNQSGIYKITNKITQKIYIGSSKNIRKRWKAHRTLLNREKHYNEYLLAAYKKYRKENKELVNEKQKNYRKENRDEYNRKQNERNSQNREEYNKKQREQLVL